MANQDQLGRFRIEARLGQGGTGTVYAAYDPHLRRQVALKILHQLESTTVERFVRGARAQASLHHPGICPVFEVGQTDEGPYIVMQRVQGRSLDEACAELPLEGRLILLRDIARAVHAAHREGLIHRDLKPSNILVEAPDDGPPRPFVVDFGLARVAEGGLTLEGDRLGTPAYMAPEQIRGEPQRIDRRTDVYALGATLYRLLAGRVPFPGDGTAALVATLEDEAAPLRPLGIPAEVEAIVFKCLEKDPQRRYASAQALADDLDRYLDGRPVEARPAGRSYRLRKWVRRNRRLVTVGGLAAVLLAIIGGWGLATAWQADERERLARVLTEQVEEIEAQVRYSHLAPLHDATPDRVELRQRMETLRADMERAGRLGQGVGNYALGRAYLALGELEAARGHLELAWEAGYQEIEVATTLAQTLSALYRERIATLEMAGDWDGRRRELERLEARYGDPVRRYLQLGQGEPSEDSLMKALMSFHQDQFDEALAVLDSAPSSPAWSYEIPALEGDIRRTWAIRLSAQGDDEAARQQLDRALDAYRRATTVAQSDSRLHLATAQTAYLRASLDILGDKDLDPLFETVQQSLERALAVDTRSPEAWLWTARLHRRRAQRLRSFSRDPTTSLKKALEATRQALEATSSTAALRSDIWLEEGRAEWAWGAWLHTLGRDPSEHLQQATQALDRVPNGERNYVYWQTRASAWTTLGDYRASLGEAALPAYQEAVLSYQQAAAEHSAPFIAYTNMGQALLSASALPETEDRMTLLQQATEAFEHARDLKPEHPVPHYYLGRCAVSLAQGGNPASNRLDLGPPGTLDAAEAHYRTALSQQPNLFAAYNALGELLHLRARDTWLVTAVSSTSDEFFRQARQAYAQGLELAPEHPNLMVNLAWTAYFQGKIRVREGHAPEDFLDEAIRLSRRVLATTDDPRAQLCLGSAWRLKAEYAMGEGSDPTSSLRAAGNAFETIIVRNPQHGEAHRSLGRLRTLEAEWLARGGGKAEPTFLQARQAIQLALELEDDAADFYLALARWALAYGQWLQSQERSSEAVLAEGLDAARKAQRRHPARMESSKLVTALNSVPE